MGMKKAPLGAAITLALAAGAAQAALFVPPGNTPLYIKFTNAEQICLAGDCITAPGTSNSNAPAAPTGTVGDAEQNWGVLRVSTIADGGDIPANQLYPEGDNTFFTGDNAGADFRQVTGIFYGIQAYPGSPANPLRSQSGYIDLWYDDASLAGTIASINAATPGDRTGVNEFTNFTDGVFLARIEFAPGIDTLGDPNVTIIGDVTPNQVGAGIQGTANSYGDVVDVNGDGVIDDLDGAWASLLNGDFFNAFIDTNGDNVPDTQVQRDFRFNNTYNLRQNWSSGNTIIGAVSDDPARVVSVPEPTTLALLGLGALGIGVGRRMRKTA